MRIYTKKDVTIETDDKTISELQDVADELIEIQMKITGDLETAKAHQQATGEYADPVWFRKANAARRAVGYNLPRLQRAIKARKKSEILTPTDEQVSFEREFMRVAKAFLPDVTYKELLRLTSMKTGEVL